MITKLYLMYLINKFLYKFKSDTYCLKYKIHINYQNFNSKEFYIDLA